MLLVSLTELQKRYTGYDPNRPEEFSTASHSIKPGLIGAGIVRYAHVLGVAGRSPFLTRAGLQVRGRGQPHFFSRLLLATATA